jgi:hypothetical protein
MRSTTQQVTVSPYWLSVPIILLDLMGNPKRVVIDVEESVIQVYAVINGGVKVCIDTRRDVSIGRVSCYSLGITSTSRRNARIVDGWILEIERSRDG